MPASFFCPITGDVLVDPVVAGDGHTYEREAILEWLRRRRESPLTRQPLDVAGLNPNIALRKAIEEWNEAMSAMRAALSGGLPLVQYADIDFSAFQDQRPAAGSFKRVVRGHLRGCNVAVAACPTGESLQVEASVLHRLGRHPHIVKFLGLAKDSEGVDHLVTEWSRYGSLDTILADMHDEDLVLEPRAQLAICQQVCEAMQALACSKVVHRDLACRNVLVFKQIRTSDPSSVDVKVCMTLLLQSGSSYPLYICSSAFY